VGLGFQQNLGKKSVMDPSCQHNFRGHQQPQGHNKQESTTFILPYGSNKQHCMDKEEFHWVFGLDGNVLLGHVHFFEIGHVNVTCPQMSAGNVARTSMFLL
jgi:hypothetical protein